MSRYADLKKMAECAVGFSDVSLAPDVVLELIADAERYQWLCDGHGYYLEEAGLCGHSNEKAEADKAIDFYIANGCPP